MRTSKYERSSELFDLCKMTSMSQRPWIACHSHPNQNHGIFQELSKTGSPHALDPNVYLYLEMWESKERAWVEAIVGTKTLNNTHHIHTKLKTYWLVVQYRYVFWRPAPTLSCFLKKYVWRNIATHKVWSLKSAKKKCKIKQNQEQWLSASQPSSSIICKLSLDVWTSHTGTRKGELKKVVKFMSRCKGLVQLFNHQRIEDQKWDFSFLNSHEIFFVQPFVRSFFRGFILHTRLAYFWGPRFFPAQKTVLGHLY